MARFYHLDITQENNYINSDFLIMNTKDFFVLFNSTEKKIVTHMYCAQSEIRSRLLKVFRVEFRSVLVSYFSSCNTHPKCLAGCDSCLRSSSHSMNWKPAVNNKLPSWVISEVLCTTFL